MSTTLSWLQTKSHAHLAITAQFDGWTTAWTTTDDTAGMLTAYSSTGMAAVKTGLDLIGEIGQSVALFQPKVDAETVTMRILEDEAGVLTGAMLRLAADNDYKTTLASDLLPAATDVTVKGQVAFPATGAIHVGHEQITYTTQTTDASSNTTGFGGLSRGVGSIFTTYDGTLFSPPHLVQRNVTVGPGFAPHVSSEPRTWYNRSVALYLHHYEGGAWTPVTSARLLWVGRIKSYKDEGNGWIAIELRSVKERLNDLVFADQWSAEIAPGWYVRPSEADVVVQGRYGGATLFTGSASFTSSDSVMTWEEIAAQSQSALDSIATAVLSPRFVQETDASGIVTRLRLELRRVDGSNFLPDEGWYIGLNPYVWWMLGFGAEPPPADYTSTNGPVAMKALHYSTTAFTLKADLAPIIYAVMEAGSVWTGEELGAKLNVSNAKGTWLNQTAGTLPATAGSASEGAVDIGGVIMGAKYDTTTITLYRRIAPTGPDTQGRPFTRGVSIREGEYQGGEMRAKQIWWERGGAGTLLARMMLSTGSAAYNDVTHDVYGTGFGLAIPYSIVDAASFVAIDQDAPEFDLVLTEPTRFGSILETVCAVTNRYPIWRNGKLTAAKPPTENAYADAAVYDLTEANKARPDDRTRVQHAPEGVINKATFEYDWDFATNKARHTIELVLLASQTDNGVGSIKHSGRGFRTEGAWNDCVVGALSNFQRPPAVLSRTYNYSLIDLEPTCLVLVTDDYMLDPVTGTRGVTDLPAWVVSTTFDLRTGVGRVDAVFTPHVSPELKCVWSPSAAVDPDGGTNGYTAGSKTLYIEANSYSLGSDAVDGTRFPAGSKIRVIQADPGSASAPQTWLDTVVSRTGNQLVLTTGLAGFSSTDRYVVECDDVATVALAQRVGHAFMADDASMSTGDDQNDARVYGADSADDAGTIGYATEYARYYNLADDAGEPLSAHKVFDLINSANNYLGRKANQVLTSDILPTAVDNGENATDTMLLYGPIALPVYKHPTRTLKVRLFGYCDTANLAGVMTVKCASAPVRGSAATSLVYPSDGQSTASVTLAYGTAAAWSAEATITPVVASASPPVTWLTVEGVCTDAATVYLSGVFVADNEL